MKKFTLIIGIVFISFSSSVAQVQEHCPPCNAAGESNHSTSTNNCHGYATARAFGMTESDECKPSTLGLSGIDDTFFNKYTYSDTTVLFTALGVGEIVGFTKNPSPNNNHSVYVTKKWGTKSNQIRVAHVPGEGGEVISPDTLDKVIKTGNYGVPKYIYTKKTKWKVRVYNDFGDDSSEVGFKFGSGTPPDLNSPHESGYFLWGRTMTINASEDGKEWYGMIKDFTNWKYGDYNNNLTFFTSDKLKTFTFREYFFTAPYKYKAYFDNFYKITFQNDFGGGIIRVNGQDKDSPHEEWVKDGNEVTGYAIDQTYKDVEFTFDEWSDSHSSRTYNFTPTDSGTYTANFDAKPKSMYYYNLHIEGDPGDPVELHWNVHEHESVSYKIWRKVKHNGEMGDPEQLASRGHSITSYEDFEYHLTEGYTDDLLYYDVRSYYEPKGTYSDPVWIDAFGEEWCKRKDEPLANQTEMPTKFEIGAYPNPFNPETTLRYRLKEQSYVTLTIRDMMGREITKLVEANQAAGQYSVRWAAKDASDNRVPSGMYFYQIKAVPNRGGDVFRKSGKLMLIK